jgi:predicted RNase H-like nuclease (RuvC/YqgF family)
MRWLMVTGMLLAVPAAGLAQGLGDAAKKEKERQKANAAAGVKVRSVDNNNLKTAETEDSKGTFSNSGGAAGSEAQPRPEIEDKAKSASSSKESRESTSAPSGMDELQRKIEKWRGRYHSAKSSVDSLEREIADLEARNSKIAGIATDRSTPRDPNLRTDAERTVESLARARRALTGAREELSRVEDGARRDGVASGQLY